MLRWFTGLLGALLLAFTAGCGARTLSGPAVQGQRVVHCAI
ncbi:hypothetical protein SAMN04489707_101067 [Paenacidovorax caeni]|uniref:Uncharacterized protein n=1 Tax=Paenacidovorax caeni TaxID=343013 RepID=A0A1I7HGB0_9BURK|nr:hypothetical protein SAMN04489707_101067 [Paenacidovorax caeni]